MVELEALDLLGLGQHDLPGGRGRRHRRGRARPRRRPRSGGGRSRAPTPGAPGASTRRRARRGARGSAAARRPRGWRRTDDGAASRCARSDAARRRPPESPRAPLAAARWSFRKAWIRSRASGGSWGLSSAASSAEIMSSLRRRAIAVHRARSIERSSTGGRVTARTTAAESVGIGEHPQPGEHVAHLGPLEEGGVAGEAERHPALLERRGHQARLAPARSRRSRRRPRAAPRRPRAGARSPAPPPGPRRARRCSART